MNTCVLDFKDSCCFNGGQQTLVLASGHVLSKTFKELYRTGFAEPSKRFCVPYAGGWSRAKLMRQPTRQQFMIALANGKEIITTDNHINLTPNGEKFTFNLTTDDYLLFNTQAIPAIADENPMHTYNTGFLLGLYLNDGVADADGVSSKKAIKLTISKAGCTDQMNIIKSALDDFGVRSEINFDAPIDGAFRIKLLSSRLLRSIRQYIIEGGSSGRRLNLDVIAMPEEMRRGILDGCVSMDAAIENHAFYSRSEGLIEDIQLIALSLGLDYKTSVNTSTIARSYSGMDVGKVQCVTSWEFPGESSGGEGVLVQDGNTYFKIVNIEEYFNPEKYVYCFRTIEREPHFMLANGVVTHNCSR